MSGDFKVTPSMRRVYPKRARNKPCFCGSGRKFKHCHGRDPEFRHFINRLEEWQ